MQNLLKSFYYTWLQPFVSEGKNVNSSFHVALLSKNYYLYWMLAPSIEYPSYAGSKNYKLLDDINDGLIWHECNLDPCPYICNEHFVTKNIPNIC